MTATRSTQPGRIAQRTDGDLRAVRQVLRRPVDAAIARGRLTGPLITLQALVPTEGLTLKDLSARIGLAHRRNAAVTRL